MFPRRHYGDMRVISRSVLMNDHAVLGAADVLPEDHFRRPRSVTHWLPYVDLSLRSSL
jgi:hypothetical protein